MVKFSIYLNRRVFVMISYTISSFDPNQPFGPRAEIGVTVDVGYNMKIAILISIYARMKIRFSCTHFSRLIGYL